MALDHIGNLPGLWRMAPCTVGSKLGFMDIDVARRAEGFRTGECEVLMTACAFCCPMLAFEGKPCRRMVEARIRSHRPGIGRVTRLTGDLEFPVWRGLCTTQRSRGKNEKNGEESPHDHCPPLWHDSHVDESGLKRVTIRASICSWR